MHIEEINDQTAQIFLSESDVESACRMFICATNPKFAVEWIISGVETPQVEMKAELGIQIKDLQR